ncbi:hypothetical protein D3C85_1386030 [compost metagenome]
MAAGLANQWKACAQTTASTLASGSGMASAVPASTVASGSLAASWARISATGSTATTLAPVAANRRVNLPVPAPRSTTDLPGASPRVSRSQCVSSAGYSGRPRA